MTERAFVIGNGKSRRNFQLKYLKGKGTVFGCNALYRDTFIKNNWDLPDYLVAIDPNIITEIESSNFPSQRFIVPPQEEQFEPVDYHLELSGIDKRGLMQNNPGLVEQIQTPRSNAGMNAMAEAIKKGAKQIFLLGFDFILATDESTTNMYEGSNAYGPETAAGHADSVNRTKYMNWFTARNPDVSFVFVMEDKKEPLRLNPLTSNNLRGMFYEEFEKEVLEFPEPEMPKASFEKHDMEKHPLEK